VRHDQSYANNGFTAQPGFFGLRGAASHARKEESGRLWGSTT
jgi:hypothetical protein